MLFAQLATAAYACPAIAGQGTPAGPGEDEPALMAGCEGHRIAAAAALAPAGAMDPDQPALCQVHCQAQAQQPTPEAPTAAAPFVPMLVAVLDWGGITMVRPARAAHAVPVPGGAPPPGSPPLYLTLSVLRN